MAIDIDSFDFENASDTEFDALLKEMEGIAGETEEQSVNSDEPSEPIEEEAADENAANEPPVAQHSTETEEPLGEHPVFEDGASGKLAIPPRLEERLGKMFPDLTALEALEVFLDGLDEEEAKKAGLDLESFKKQEEEKREFEAFKKEKAKKQSDEETRNGIISQWRADSERLSKFIPGFDFNTAMENGQFRDKVIKEGKDIITAYFELNPINKAQESTPKRRDVENALMDGYASGVRSPMDFSSMSRKDLEELEEKFRNNR